MGANERMKFLIHAVDSVCALVEEIGDEYVWNERAKCHCEDDVVSFQQVKRLDKKISHMYSLIRNIRGYIENERKLKRDLYKNHMNNKVDPPYDDMYWR